MNFYCDAPFRVLFAAQHIAGSQRIKNNTAKPEGAKAEVA
jgi:hypothetical protein